MLKALLCYIFCEDVLALHVKLKSLVDCRLLAGNSCGSSAQQCQCRWVHKVQQASQWST